MTPFITEMLDEINRNPELLKTKYKDSYPIKTLLQYAFDKRLKMDLPEGTPPFKADPMPQGMSPANFYQQVKKLYIFTRKDLKSTRREILFIQLLEGLHPSEARVCVLVKDQSLTLDYPSITPDVVVDAGFVAKENVVEFVSPVKEPVVVDEGVFVDENATVNRDAEVVDEEKPKKRRGRPPKARTEGEAPKRRGRPPKKKEE